jgi:hypothetical protein
MFVYSGLVDMRMRVTVTILNNQPRTAEKGWSSSLGVGVGLTTPHGKKIMCYESQCFKVPRTWTDSLA